MKNILFFLLLLMTMQGYGQPAQDDVLEEEAQIKAQIKEGNLSDEETVSTYIKLIDYCVSKWNDIEKARKYTYEALKWADEKDSDLWRATFIHQFGLDFWNIRQIDSAEVYYNRAFDIIESRNPELECKIYLSKGAICQFKGDNECAISYYMKVLDLSKLVDDEKFRVDHIVSCNGNIGMLYEDMGNKEKGEEYLLKAKDMIDEYKEKYNIKHLARSIYYTLADTYKRTDKGDEALKLAKQAYEISVERGRKTDMVMDLTMISSIYLINFKNDKEALKYAKESLIVAEETGITYYITIAERELVTYYLNTANEREALKYALSVLAKTDSSDYNSLQWTHYCLVGIYAGLGNLDKVEEHLNKYKDYMEMFSDENMHNAIQDMLVKYDTQEKEVEIMRQQVVIARQNNERTMLVSGLAVAVIVLLSLWLLLRLRTKRNSILAEMNDTKDKFFSIISHDLKNPALTQRNALQMLVDHSGEWDEKSLSQYYSELLKSSESQVELLYNLLNWAQVQTGRMPYIPSSFDLAVALRSEIELIRSMAEQKNIALTIEMPEEAIVTGDLNMITTVVRNLMTNSIKFTNSEGEVSLNITTSGDYYTVSVSDTGIGMNDQQLQNLFRIENRNSKSGTAGEQGSGLGLIVCKELLEKHGIILNVESAEGKGSRFWFEVGN